NSSIWGRRPLSGTVIVTEIVATRVCRTIVRHPRGGHQAESRLRSVAMNAIALLGRVAPDLTASFEDVVRPGGLLAATYVDQYCASEYRTLECTAIAAAFGTVWIARLVFLRSCAGGCVLSVDFAPLAPSSFSILRAGDRPRLAAYSLPSIGATCGGSRSRYGRPTASSVSCASTHFHSCSLAANRCRRVSPLTLTRSTASPWP